MQKLCCFLLSKNTIVRSGYNSSSHSYCAHLLSAVLSTCNASDVSSHAKCTDKHCTWSATDRRNSLEIARFRKLSQGSHGKSSFLRHLPMETHLKTLSKRNKSSASVSAGELAHTCAFVSCSQVFVSLNSLKYVSYRADFNSGLLYGL